MRQSHDSEFIGAFTKERKQFAVLSLIHNWLKVCTIMSSLSISEAESKVRIHTDQSDNPLDAMNKFN